MTVLGSASCPPSGLAEGLEEKKVDDPVTSTVIGTTAPTSSQARSGLWRGSLALLVSNGLTLACTFAFWAVVNHTSNAEVSGRAAAVMSAIALVGGISQGNLQAVFQRVVPTHRRPRRFAARGYGACVSVAAVLSVLAIVVAGSVDALRFVTDDPALMAVLFVGSVTTAVFAIEDGVLGALGRHGWIPGSNATFSLVRMALVLRWHGSVTQIVLVWFAPMVICTLAVNAAVFVRWLPARRDRESSTAAVSPRYLTAEALSWVLATGCQWSLPVLVLVTSGAAASQAFYLAMTAAVALGAVVVSITGGFTVAVAREPAQLGALLRRAALAAGGLTVVGAGALAVAAPVVMHLFGVDDEALGVEMLRLMAVAGVLRVTVSLSVAVARARLDGFTLVALQIVHAGVVVVAITTLDGARAAAQAWVLAQAVTGVYAIWRWRSGP